MRGPRGFPAWRWALLAVVLIVGAVLVARPWDGSSPTRSTVPVAESAAPVPGAARAAAALADCPAAAPGVVPAGPLAGLTLDCLATGRPVPLAAALAGRPALLNLWAYWCQPCAQELPALRDYAQRAGDKITVLTVHSDPAEAKGLARLTDLDVHLPGVQDGAGRVQNAVGAPQVLPVTVLIRPDGTVAKLVVRPFSSADDIAATVAAALGVTA
ncbi:TlpA family protein disulfide reductase [Nocardia stercoris]|uniref:TlpA family protein disulfide reductase n=1 Tax=Nocardia stercoris TaxID=2483361 RepID=A0A3M2KXX2_9NOCA|nr:TlpA disulfide reductase family protein [Nocardia stercoris]RMI29310.1 TlpA family protein disulfide reductase [Nocardia stercoris]